MAGGLGRRWWEMVSIKNPACLVGGPGFFEIEITSKIAQERVLGSVRSGSMMRQGMTQQRR